MSIARTWGIGLLAGAALAVGLSAGVARAHCEIPCGIYGDETRFAVLREHVATVEKSMKQIEELSAAGEKNYNQIVRWVDNKEKHCLEIQHIATQYFLTQRIKPLPPDADTKAKQKYYTELRLLHEIVVYAMKGKQTTDTANTARLLELIEQFEHIYLEKH